MTAPAEKTPLRILVVDDNPSIHDDIRKVLAPPRRSSDALQDAKALLFGDDAGETARDEFVIDSAFQGDEALEMVRAAVAGGTPYAMAFVDVRMPPGWDGIETVTRTWKEQPDLQVVICTAYSDYSWEDMVAQIGRSPSMVVLKKPFDNIEVLQLAHALTEKWTLGRHVAAQIRDLDRAVDERTRELVETNERLTREIGERQRAELALEVSEERFSKAFAANPLPLAIQSLGDGRFTDANLGFAQLTGSSLDEIRGRTADELGLWIKPAQSREILDQVSRKGSVRHLPCQLRTRTATVRDVLLSVETIDLSGRPFLLTIMQDVTEQLLLEKQLRQSQKMEAVGQLAAGIAHDFNNMLTVIQGNTALILADNPDPAHRTMLDGVMRAAQRSARLVRQLLTFSHRQVVEIRPVVVGEVLASLSEMLPRMLGEQVRLEVGSAPDLPAVPADVGMIEQLLVNLAVNSRDAMPRGGTLRIEARAMELGEDVARINKDARAGRFVCLEVSDTGDGIPPEALPRIFEPFFTTKPVGKGTGLGLATAYGIARQHEGWIDVETEAGRGTKFRIFLPAGEATVATPPPEVRPAATESRGAETIFVVEDEDVVRSCVCAVLKSRGYAIVNATNGVEALDVWREHGERIDLLLTDVVMPGGLNGVELAEKLTDARPGLKVIYTSGYSNEFHGHQARIPDGHRFLAKPYETKALAEIVRATLDSATTAA